MSRSLVTSIMMLSLLIPSACAASASSPQVASPSSATAAVATDNEYTLAPGDKVRVIVFGEETLTGEYVITSGGNLSFPLVGNMKVTDKTVEQVQVALAAALADGYVNNPRVNIQVISFRPFYILGEVNRPGEYPVSTGLTLQQAVASAGGYTYRANLKRAYLKRANDTEEKLLIVKSSGPVIIRAGDTIRIGERHF
ncbi:polysaccharide export protein [Sphingomonas paeninsulae]|jgi:protein involved in polysaccharide export with SLBB domain|uniref:Polysaccharide export protein n=1 Tax=Sphingomonas paeninsulae TaxID=2319844 RepID=A0A494TJ08_SPHPE|nr:polysaccharide biosynthesis/export family protein [Sphingomonas paeninsulae]AYJ86973.1 polysaccharide export protein [Sphingomonas paeninsulae]